MRSLVLVYGETSSTGEDVAIEVGELFDRFLPKDYEVQLFCYGSYSEYTHQFGGDIIHLDRYSENKFICGDTMAHTHSAGAQWIIKPGFRSAQEIVCSKPSDTWVVADTCASSGNTISRVITQIREMCCECSKIIIGTASQKAIDHLSLFKMPIEVLRPFGEGKIIELRDILGEGEQFLLSADGKLSSLPMNTEDVIGSLPLTFRAVREVNFALRRIQRK